MPTATTKLDEAAELLQSVLGTCASRSMFTLQEVLDVGYGICGQVPESVWSMIGDFCNEHRDSGHIGAMKVGDLMLDVLIAIDKIEVPA